MMKEKAIRTLKLIVTITIIVLFVWFLVLSPMITFRNNEKKLENAARRYYEINPNHLPTGERIKTLSLKTLYRQSYIEGDIFIPYTHKTCSIDNSWVKVRRENGEFKYYTYLECGILSSTVDHKGPEIQLKGEKEEVVDLGKEYKDPGIKSVVDNVDGTMKSTDVTVKSEVDTSKIGTYDVTYTAFDSMGNKSEVTRSVKVVKTFYSTVKADLGDTTNYVGDPKESYVWLSNMLFRIYGLDSDKNVILVADEDIANVSYSKLDKWLDYYYDHLNETTQKMIVKKKYCNMTLTDTTLDTTSCSGYTEEKNVYIPSIIDINKVDYNGYNYMKPNTISWTANRKSKEEAYVTRDFFFEEDAGKLYVSYDVNNNYGVRPMFTVTGKALISGGDGTIEKPYTFGDTIKAKGGSLVNERFTGEYLSIDGMIFRIVDVQKDGTTRVISNRTLGDSDDDVRCTANPFNDKIVYDPKDQYSVAYFINSNASKYLNVSYFANHEFEVPIYKNKILYGEEVETKKIKTKVAAPDMFEMFAAQPQRDSECSSFWLINSSKADRIVGAVYLIGVPINEKMPAYGDMRIRVAGYLKKNTIISSGNGTYYSPYVIK